MIKQISEDEKLLIQDFIHTVDEMTNSKFIEVLRAQTNISFSMNFQKDIGLRVSTTTPKNEGVSWYLSKFRQLYMQKERINLMNVLNIIHKYELLPEESKRNVIALRKQYNDYLNGKPRANFTYNNVDLTESTRSVIDLFLNGEFFHSDPRNVQILNALKMTPLYEMLRHSFVMSIIDLGDIVFRIRNNLDDIDFKSDQKDT